MTSCADLFRSRMDGLVRAHIVLTEIMEQNETGRNKAEQTVLRNLVWYILFLKRYWQKLASAGRSWQALGFFCSRSSHRSSIVALAQRGLHHKIDHHGHPHYNSLKVKWVPQLLVVNVRFSCTLLRQQ